MSVAKNYFVIAGGVLSLVTFVATYLNDGQSYRTAPIATPSRTVPVEIGTNVGQHRQVKRAPNEKQGDDAIDALEAEREAMWRRLVAATKLDELEKQFVARSDIEIRIWALPGLIISETKGWQFIRVSDEWSAFAFVSDSEGQTLTKTPLKPRRPVSEWSTFVNERLSPSSIRDLSYYATPDNDSIEVILEVNAGGEYVRKVILDGPFLKNLFQSMKAEFARP